jgi:hypothetical protein
VGSGLIQQKWDRFEIAARRLVDKMLRDDLSLRDPPTPAVLGDGDPGV